MQNRLHALVGCFFCFLTLQVSAQISAGGRPPSFESAYTELLAAWPEPVQLPALDIAQVRAEDQRRGDDNRFAAPVATDIRPENAGEWKDLPDGSRVWRCALRSEGAQGLILLFNELRLPEGARLFACTPDGAKILGAYTQRSCIPSGKFTIGILPGEEVVLECTVPAGAENDLALHLDRVDCVYKKEALDQPEDFGDALPCNININCPLGANYQIEKKGIARILMVFGTGSAWCSGSMIANTAGTPEPYFLTAHHCQILLTQPEFDQWVFHFDYEAPGCNNPGGEPTPKSVLGCERISFRAETDFLLLKLNPIPPTYGVYFNGWERTNGAPVSNSVFIHHPQGDIKKISADTNAATIYGLQLNWGAQFGISPANSHWRVVPDHGPFQPGSSGSPLLDQNKRIVGQLHGGSINMTDPCLVTAYFGRFDQSWNQGTTPDSRLREWLDPGNLNQTVQNGYAQPAPTTVNISGNVQTHWSTAMSNVRVLLSGDAQDTVLTDVSGNYSFPNLAAGGTYTIRPERDTNDINGVTTFDLVQISKHLLGLEPFNSPWKILAGDANRSNTVTTFDIVESRKVILGINNAYPANTAWRFLPADIVFPDPNNPFAGVLLTESLTLENVQIDTTGINFRGVKIGDVNNSAIPGQ